MGIIAGFMVPHPPMIVPDIGRGSEAQIADTTAAYERVADEIAALAPDTIVITSPHSIMYSDYIHISPGRSAGGSFAGFRAPNVRFSEEYDAELVKEICRLADEEDFPAGTLGEREKDLDHGTMVPLWFIRNKYKGGKIVRTGLSGLPLIEHYRFGMMIREAAENTGRRVVIVASGDLSHKLQDYGPYGYVPEGPEYDGTAVRAERLVHQDVTGVGYGICTFYPEGADESRHFLDRKMAEIEDELRSKRERSDEYVRLAREAVEAYVLRREVLDVPAGLPEEMLSKQAGTFVSIHEHGELRGCIGTISPTRSSVAEEIIGNAISASTRDPRFPAIKPDELPWLDINVDVLGEPEDIGSEDELDVKRYGVIVSCGHRRGLLLPDLDGIDTPRQQVEIAMKKGGIRKFERYKLQRFEVIRHY